MSVYKMVSCDNCQKIENPNIRNPESLPDKWFHATVQHICVETLTAAPKSGLSCTHSHNLSFCSKKCMMEFIEENA